MFCYGWDGKLKHIFSNNNDDNDNDDDNDDNDDDNI
mgnify:CR=1 FL=1